MILTSSRGLIWRYRLTFGLLLILLLISQVVIQVPLNEQQDSGSIISQVGRQRMLSQQIVKTALLVEADSQKRQELADITEQWEQNQQTLRNLPDQSELQAQYADLALPFNAMLTASQCLSARACSQSEATAALLAYEDDYIAGMDAIVASYERSYRSSIRRIQTAELILALIKVSVLLIMTRLVILPAVYRLKWMLDSLSESEARYRLLAENATDIIARLNLDGEFLYVSPAVHEILGYEPQDLIGTTIYKLAHPEDVPALREGYQKLQMTAFTQTVTYRLLHQDGHYLWMETTVQRFHGTKTRNGQELMTVSRSIHKRKRAEDALKASEARFRALNDASPLGIFLTNAEGYCLYSNVKYQEIAGLTFDELLGDGWNRAVHPEDRAAVMQDWRQTMAQEATFARTQRYQHQDGTVVWVNIKAAPIRDVDQLMGYIGMVENVTDRKLAEEALFRNEQLYRSLYEQTNDGIFIIDLAGQYLNVNPQAAELLGYTVKELMTMRAEDVIVPGEYAASQQVLTRLQAGEKVPFYERTFRRKDGTEFPVEINVTAIRDADGEPKYIQSVVRDITQRKQAEAALQSAKVAAESASRAKTLFLANMSHELRTPLNAILGFAQLMASEPNLDSERRENLEVITRSGEHLLNLINNVLEMSKIEVGQITLNEISFDLHQLLRDVEEMFSIRAEAKSLRLVVESDTPQYFYGDASKLRQVLINMLSNALKFTEEGGVALRVQYQDDQLRFEVQDSGPGIAPEELDRVFEPFVQTSTGQKSNEGGTGLGMAITREFVHLMGGNIRVSSQLGQGTLFQFEVQLRLLEQVPLPPPEKHQRVLALAPDQPRYRVLVVEDRHENRRLLVKLMRAVGFEVQEAVNGQEAITRAEIWQPHLIWMDMRMPVMDGREATHHIKAAPWGQKMVIIALTASAFEHERSAILAAGCDDYVAKPFNRTDLFEKMVKHLGVRFLYLEQSPVEVSVAEAVVSPEQLKALPPDLMAALQQAAQLLDMEKSNEVIQQIRALNPSLSEELTALVRSFRFDKILALTQDMNHEE